MKIGNRGELTSSGDSSLRENNENSLNKKYEEFDIKVEKIDDFLKRNEIKDEIKFIKIDVELHEEEAFQGMKETLLNHSPILFFEQHNDNEVSSPVINLLKSWGYNYFYEPSIIKKWKFAKIYRLEANSIIPKISIVNKIIKLLELIFFKSTKEEPKLLLREKFYKTKYMCLIVSKKPLSEDIVY